MAKIYCLLCNQSTSYESSKPKFCSHCGKPYLDGITTVPVSQKAPPANPSNGYNRIRRNVDVEPLDEDVEYPEDAVSVPKIDKIECSLTVSNLRPNRESGKDVFSAGTINEAQEVLNKTKNRKNTKVNKTQQNQIKENFKEQFRNELSTNSRRNRNSTEISE